MYAIRSYYAINLQMIIGVMGPEGSYSERAAKLWAQKKELRPARGGPAHGLEPPGIGEKGLDGFPQGRGREVV